MKLLFQILSITLFASCITLPQDIQTKDNPFPKFVPYLAEKKAENQIIAYIDIKDLGKEQPARFLSVDRFAYKYPSFNPYHYAANNPMRFIDVNGDSLDLAGNQTKALTYVQSILDPKYQSRITVDNNGRVSFDIQGLNLSSDAALTLLNNIINGSPKYLFEVLASNSNVVGVLRYDGDFGKAGSTISNIINGVANYSVTPRNAEGGTGTSGLLPRNGYDGQIALGEGSYTFLNGNPQPISNIVFHELSENYNRTVGGYPYMYPENDPRVGAHYRAIIDATKSSNQILPFGEGKYVP